MEAENWFVWLPSSSPAYTKSWPKAASTLVNDWLFLRHVRDPIFRAGPKFGAGSRFVLHLLKIVWNEFTIVCRLILLTNFNCQLQTDCLSKSKQPYFSWKRMRLSFISKSCLKIGLQNLVTSFRNGNLTVGLSALHINSLGPSDAIWRQRSGSTLAQVMACCLTALSHYLNHCRLIFSKVEWHSLKGKFTRDTSAINHWNYL